MAYIYLYYWTLPLISKYEGYTSVTPSHWIINYSRGRWLDYSHCTLHPTADISVTHVWQGCNIVKTGTVHQRGSPQLPLVNFPHMLLVDLWLWNRQTLTKGTLRFWVKNCQKIPDMIQTPCLMILKQCSV